jgi:hypothetical protein
MSLSPGLSKQTNNNLRYGPSSRDEESPFRIDSVVKNYIPGQTTPETEVNESFLWSSSLSSPGGSLIIPVNIFYKDVSSPSSELELELEPEETPTQLEATGMNNNNNNNNNKKRNTTTPASTSNKNPIKYNDKDDEIFRNLYLNLDTTIAHPLDDDTMKEFASTFRQVKHYMVDRPCQQCGDIACSEKINNTYSLVVAKTSGFIEEDRRYADSWDDMFKTIDSFVSIFISFTKT